MGEVPGDLRLHHWWGYITCIRLTSTLREKSLAIIVCLGWLRDIIRNIIVITGYKVRYLRFLRESSLAPIAYVDWWRDITRSVRLTSML